MTERANIEKEVFGEALEFPQSERPAFLCGACRGDASLLRRVEALLSHATEDVSTTITQKNVVKGALALSTWRSNANRNAMCRLRSSKDSKEVIARFDGERQARAIVDLVDLRK